jgi:hypothetical protein
MGNGYNILGYGTLDTFLLAPGEYINVNSHVQATNLCNIVQNPDERVTKLTRSSSPIFYQVILKDHVLSKHPGLVSQVCHCLCGRQGRQEGVLPQLGLV